MQYSEGRIGRVFALRLEEGERLPDAIEDFARKHAVKAGMVIYVGGAAAGSRLVVGPDAQHPDSIVPLVFTLGGIQEVLALGTLFPDDEGKPILHLHAATGREGRATVGCTRAGVDVWLVGEVVILEFTGIEGYRGKVPQTDLKLLHLKSGV